MTNGVDRPRRAVRVQLGITSTTKAAASAISRFTSCPSIAISLRVRSLRHRCGLTLPGYAAAHPVDGQLENRIAVNLGTVTAACRRSQRGDALARLEQRVARMQGSIVMRIVTGGIAQETNTFQWQPTTLEDFQRPGFGSIARGEEILALGGTGTVYGGVVPEAAALGVELIPTTFGWVMPGGRVERAAFDALREEILAGIAAALPVDGVLLVLHGAMALTDADDAEGLLLADVRALVGPDVPIVVPLDLHTNLSDEMAALADALVGYKEYPHTDMPETGAHALQILAAIVRGEATPAMAHVRLPLIVPNQSMVTTWQSPLKIAIDRAREMEQRAGRPGGDAPGRLPLRRRPLHRGLGGRGDEWRPRSGPPLRRRAGRPLLATAGRFRYPPDADRRRHRRGDGRSGGERLRPGRHRGLRRQRHGRRRHGRSAGAARGRRALGGARPDHGPGGGRRLCRRRGRQRGHPDRRRQARRAARPSASK